jgi:dienelactone hydrolase
MRSCVFFFLAAVWGAAQTLPGTTALTMQGDMAAHMLDGMDRWLARETAATAGRRPVPDRARFRKIIGVVDARVRRVVPELDATVDQAALVAETPGYRVYAVRWAALEGLDAEGLLLEPKRAPLAQVVAVPDADLTPEMLVGLAPGGAPLARRLAENGCRVLVPVLIDRKDTWSGDAGGRFTNQPHREWIHRMAYQMGRTVMGFEVQKVLAAVDWFTRSRPNVPVGVAGYGEGGLVAFYSAAVDERIGAALVSGYFGPREELWQEPIYRNVWGLVREFGDVGVAVLVAPRVLVVEASRQPEVSGPPPVREGRRGGAPGRIVTPPIEVVRAECARAGKHVRLIEKAAPGSDEALVALLGGLGVKTALKRAGAAPVDRRKSFDPVPRMKRQFDQMVEFVQAMVRRSPEERKKFWARADTSSVEKWSATTEWYKRYFWEEIIGKMPEPSEPMRAETRRIYDRPKFTGYEVLLPVWPDVFAYGILLLPKDLKPGERRPVVVCQHGLSGRPQDVIDPPDARTGEIYAHFGAALAERGFIVYAPQNPYIFDRFRQTQRRANALKLAVYSFILGEHQRTLDWLAEQPFVDPKRIAFYGLSYGGKTAVRVPPLLDKYALSICSGDFNEWIWKLTDTRHAWSYMFTHEYEIMEFDMGNTFNYAELASLMAPRPFMVERGHADGVSVDEWVAYEYAKVRRFYASLGLADRTEIEFFQGPHQIHGVGTYRFLECWLDWPPAGR